MNPKEPRAKLSTLINIKVKLIQWVPVDINCPQAIECV